jgi:hypothetical protein
VVTGCADAMLAQFNGGNMVVEPGGDTGSV